MRQETTLGEADKLVTFAISLQYNMVVQACISYNILSKFNKSTVVVYRSCKECRGETETHVTSV